MFCHYKARETELMTTNKLMEFDSKCKKCAHKTRCQGYGNNILMC
uniref:Uncharacterized protein n=1 Tax=Arundo donax TaxID=35708 RepID=A0A0A9T810_ARUDO